jgi:anti-anti-sigma factor
LAASERVLATDGMVEVSVAVEIDDAGGDPAVVHASGELDLADDSLARTLLELIDGGRHRVVVDLLEVTFIDSSVVQALVVGYREASKHGGWLRVVYTRHLIGRVLEICGLAELLPQFTTVEAAVRG